MTKTTRPRLTSVDLWERHTERCLQILREALIMLNQGPPDERETDLNRRLYLAIIDAHATAARGGVEQLAVVVPEGRSPPVASDAERAAREAKIPDFYWAYVDHLAEPGASRQFVLECKRLTESTRNWIYTERYVHEGVVRFITPEHAYGKDTPSGAMVGYLQAIDFDQALNEVNACAASLGIPPLAARGDPSAALAEFDHRLSRSFAVSPFLLTHIWARRQPAAHVGGPPASGKPPEG
jgi:hypothetical protein